MRKAEVLFINEEIELPEELESNKWLMAKRIKIDKYWSGKNAPSHRHFWTDLLWSTRFLYVRFIANQKEPLVVSENPNLHSKTIGLWESDVCEIFIAPEISNYHRYFEFEIAPNGEWLDLEITKILTERLTNWIYESKMSVATIFRDEKLIMAMKIPWKAFDITPKAGDKWMGNIFRCVGTGENRGHMAWSPTKTEAPNFHVPEKFGIFDFVKT